MGKKSHKAMPFLCGACKAGFGSEKALLDHIGHAHPAIHSCGVYRCIARVNGPEHEPSYGEDLGTPIPAARGMRRADAFADMLEALYKAEELLAPAFEAGLLGDEAFGMITSAVAKAEARS